MDQRGESLILLVMASMVMAITLGGVFRALRSAEMAGREAACRQAAIQTAENGLAHLRFQIATRMTPSRTGKLPLALVSPDQGLSADYSYILKGRTGWFTVTARWGTRHGQRVSLSSFEPLP